MEHLEPQILPWVDTWERRDWEVFWQYKEDILRLFEGRPEYNLEW